MTVLPEVLMRESYTTSASALAEQARKVGDVLAELRTAADTAGSVALTSNAFGEPAAEAVTVLDRLGTAGLDTVVAAMNSLTEAGSRLRDTATEYEQQEAAGRSAYNELAEPGSPGLVV
ncbi:hypothetical protein [Actinophytocola sp.]|uniref:hypothetical protein n=1 Tax=Actinophytocola sp. TaxID=1872138 RepID=UPI002ED16E8A